VNYGVKVNRKSDKKKKMKFDWTNITKRNRSNRENCIRFESSGTQKKRYAEENVAKSNSG